MNSAGDKTMTAIETLTDKQIAQLAVESGRAGDTKMTLICADALEGGPATTSAEGGAAKVDQWEEWVVSDAADKITLKINGANVDPYATHRLAGDRRRAELMAERPKWATQLAEVTERLAVIDRELDRLDRTGEVE